MPEQRALPLGRPSLRSRPPENTQGRRPKAAPSATTPSRRPVSDGGGREPFPSKRGSREGSPPASVSKSHTRRSASRWSLALGRGVGEMVKEIVAPARMPTVGRRSRRPRRRPGRNRGCRRRAESIPRRWAKGSSKTPAEDRSRNLTHSFFAGNAKPATVPVTLRRCRRAGPGPNHHQPDTL